MRGVQKKRTQRLDFKKSSIKKVEKKCHGVPSEWLQIATMSPFVAGGPAQIIA
jgi:hypothetical protein